MSDSSLQILEKAKRQFQGGFPKHAVRLCRRIPEQDRYYSQALALLGAISLETGQSREAARFLLQAARLAPTDEVVWKRLGKAYTRMGQATNAAIIFCRISILNPAYIEINHALMAQFSGPDRTRVLMRATILAPLDGNACQEYGADLMRAKKPIRAAEQFRRLLALSPGHSDGLFHLANVLMDVDDIDGAKKFFLRTLYVAPQSGTARNNLGLIAFGNGQFDRAEEWFSAATTTAPGLPEAWLNRSRALQKLGRDGDAIKPCKQGLIIDPIDQLACCEIADLLNDVRWAKWAIAINPDAPQPFTRLAVLATRVPGRKEVGVSLRRGAVVKPDDPETWFNLSVEAGLESDPERQVEYGFRTTCIDDSHGEARNNMAFGLLALERFEPGWRTHARRMETAEGRKIRRHFAIPEWDGSAIAGRHLLLWGEQGIGDEVQFLTLLSHVMDQCGRVTVFAEPRLRPLIKRAFPDVSVPDVDEPSGEVEDHHGADMHLAIGDLPHHLGLFSTTDLVPAPWIVADQDRVTALRSRLLSRHPGKRLVGIAWRSEAPKTGERRTIRPRFWQEVGSVFDVALVSLQYSVREQDLAAFEDTGIELDTDHGIDPIQDLDGLAALIAAMDLVISPPNNTVHIAGAMGVPCWVALPTRPDWRWGLSRDTSLWYPGTRVYRQQTDGDWPPVLAAIANDLENPEAGQTPVLPSSTQTTDTEDTLIRSEDLSEFHDRLRVGRTVEAECSEMVTRCEENGRLAEAICIFENAVRFLHPTEAFQRRGAALVEAMDASGGIETFLKNLPNGRQHLRDMFTRMTAELMPVHGPNGARPGTAAFLRSVTLKGMCIKFDDGEPVRDVLARFSEHYARRAAEEAFGQPAISTVISADIAQVVVAGREFRFHTSNPHTRIRFQYFFLHEPGLLRLISTFGPDDVFLDIGANVGSFTAVAAGVRGCKVFAIEPFSTNYAELQRNIELNNIGDRVTPLRIAISDTSEEGRFAISAPHIGSAAHAFDEPPSDGPTGSGGNEQVQGYRLDDLISEGRIDFPTHIKIDVDGTEHRIIAGMPETLADPRLRSLRMEVDLTDPRNIAAVRIIEAAGFNCLMDDDPKNLLCLREDV